jgi:3-phenylpropionate/trans-cinnamate dioxygenase ferredoxin reductase subunit
VKADALLVGGGVASAECARELRERGFDGSVLLAGREMDPPYERPPCSKEYLRGTVQRDAIALKVPEDVEVRTRTSVLRLDPAARTATLSDKSTVEYGQALVATGANVRRLPVDGAQLEGIHYLRALGNADGIRRDAERAREAVVVGGSYLGTELAASLVAMGLQVTMVFLEDVPLERHYGRTAGAWFAGQLEQRGVRLVGGATLAAFTGDGEGDDARVTGVRAEDGREIGGELVVVAAGAVPDVMLARQSGLPLGELGGVRCDAGLRVVGVEGLFAAGDMCEWDSVLHGGPARVEHWEVAAAQGRTAARNMLGEDVVHDEVPYFWSDLGDWATSEYVGVAADGGWDDEVVRGSLDDGAFTIWHLREGRVVAALSVGRGEDLDEARRLIVSREAVSREDLAVS